MASGCGEFVRDELISMQNEIDFLYEQVQQINAQLTNVKAVVDEMADGGFIDYYEVEHIGDTTVYTLHFLDVDEDGNLVPGQTPAIVMRSGIDGEDAEPFIVGVKQDEEDGRWYWYDTRNEDWMYSPEGERFLVDGKDGKTPKLKIEEGYWCISWDNGETWQTTDWKAKGEDAREVFSNVEIFDDRIDLTLAADSTVLSILRYLPADVTLTIGGSEIAGPVAMAGGETVSIAYTLTGSGAEYATLVAGTDGRLKTTLTRVSSTEGVVNVTSPEVFPEGSYIYVIVNDGNGRSVMKVINFVQRDFSVLYGEAEYSAAAVGETGLFVTFESNFPLAAVCEFPEGVDPWITLTVAEEDGLVAVTYDILPNESADARTAAIVVTPQDNPALELFRQTVTQAGVTPDPGTGSGE